MTTTRKLQIAGVSDSLASAIMGEVAPGLTATGTTQATAFRINTDVAKFTNVVANTGAILPVASHKLDVVEVINAGGDALLLYPALGEQIGSSSSNTPISIASGSAITLRKVSDMSWDIVSNYAVSSGGGGGIAGTIAATQVAYGSGSDEITGSDEFVVIGGQVGIGTITPTSKFHVSGSQSVKTTNTAANYAVLSTDYIIRVTDTSAARTITLPTAGGIAGRIYEIKDASGGAAVNNITIDADGAETIDGVANKKIVTNYGAIKVISNGSNWDLINNAQNYNYGSFVDPVRIPLSTATGWDVETVGTGSTSINTALQRVTYTCAPGGSANCYAFYDLVSLIAGFDGAAAEVYCRLVEMTNTVIQGYTFFGLGDSTNHTGFFLLIRGDGRLETGHLDSSGLATETASIIGSMPVDGTGWLRVRINGGILSCAYGTGTTSAPPAARAWKMMRTMTPTLEISGEFACDTFVFGVEQPLSPASTITVSIDNIFARRLY